MSGTDKRQATISKYFASCTERPRDDDAQRSTRSQGQRPRGEKDDAIVLLSDSDNDGDEDEYCHLLVEKSTTSTSNEQQQEWSTQIQKGMSSRTCAKMMTTKSDDDDDDGLSNKILHPPSTVVDFKEQDHLDATMTTKLNTLKSHVATLPVPSQRCDDTNHSIIVCETW